MKTVASGSRRSTPVAKGRRASPRARSMPVMLMGTFFFSPTRRARIAKRRPSTCGRPKASPSRRMSSIPVQGLASTFATDCTPKTRASRSTVAPSSSTAALVRGSSSTKRRLRSFSTRPSRPLWARVLRRFSTSREVMRRRVASAFVVRSPLKRSRSSPPEPAVPSSSCCVRSVPDTLASAPFPIRGSLWRSGPGSRVTARYDSRPCFDSASIAC